MLAGDALLASSIGITAPSLLPPSVPSAAACSSGSRAGKTGAGCYGTVAPARGVTATAGSRLVEASVPYHPPVTAIPTSAIGAANTANAVIAASNGAGSTATAPLIHFILTTNPGIEDLVCIELFALARARGWRKVRSYLLYTMTDHELEES